MNTSTGNQVNANRRRIGIHRAAGIIVAVLFSVLGVFVVASAADQLGISITNTLSPSNATIQVGTTVTWTNNDTEAHELRSGSGPVDFRTDELQPGQSASITFTTPGTYTYLDHHNQDSKAYRGSISVIDGAAPATPPAIGVTPAAPSTASIRLAGGQFSPTTVTVAVGATVTWSNDDGSKHTVTADNASFDSGTLNAGATFVHTFAAAGTYTYGCDFHGNMRGTVIVIAAVGSPAPVPVSPTAPAPAPVPPAAPPAAPAPGSGATNESVSIANNLFSPSSITVNAGSSVTWANVDTATHTVTADDQSFNSGLMKKATSWSRTFATAGTFAYFCEIHPDMVGTVIAKAPDGSVPLAATAATSDAANTAGTPAAATPAGNSATTGGSAGAATGFISINDIGFTPSSFRLAVGGTLTFANNGKATHTATAGNGSFDSDLIKPGGTWAHTFATPGSFTYTCILHPNMRGTVDVGSSGVGNATGATESASATPQQDSAPTTIGGGPTNSATQSVTVDVADNQFNPNPATVAVGGTVTWRMTGAAAHTATADDKSFNSGLLKPGESYQYTFTTLGSFAYTCLVHEGMTGTIDVVPPDQAAQQVASPPTNGDGSQTQQAASPPAAVAAAGPARNAGLWGDTLLGIAAVLLACCVLVLALKSFLKVLGSNDPSPVVAASPADGLLTRSL